ncbi:MAG: family NAD(P)-dependent oxidoreductase [Ramlibacter sp.]|nr:family NAD(P)-dependent oxidoreductase [Ramlibacter sp.]
MGALQDKSIVVIGAGRGIGAAVAAYLAAEGAALLVADIDEAAAEQTAARLRDQGRRAASMRVDVTRWEDCAALVARCVDLHGRLDGVANFAGIVYLRTPWEESEGDSARRLFEVNLLGTYNVGVHAMQQMRRQGGGGSIVNTSSGTQAGMAAGAAYSASKGGVASLTYAWAMDGAPDGIRVNAISPVATTAMTQNTDEYMRAKGQLQGARPYVDPACNAPAVAFFLSDAAKQVSGQVLRVHGEQVQLMSHPAVLLPVLEQADWDVESLASALAQAFPQGLPPLGLSGLQGKFEPLKKVNQVPR